MRMGEPYASIERLAVALQGSVGSEECWKEFEQALGTAYGHILFTVSAFDLKAGLLLRLHSNRPEVNPVGGVKSVTDSFWTRRVLLEGQIYVGSDQADIQSVFSEYRKLALIGCDSVLNIPVRKAAVTLGTINLLGAAGQYDRVNKATALVFAALAAGPLTEALSSEDFEPAGDSGIERV